jgi:chromosome segregation ATPase
MNWWELANPIEQKSNQLSALLSNWKTYEKMLSDYQNANGSALEEAQKTADSIEGRLNKLSNTWNEAVANVVSSDMLKTFVSIGTGAIELADDINLLQTALIGLGGLSVYKGLTTLVPMLQNAISSTLAFGNALNVVKAKDFVADTTNLSKAISGLTLSQASAVLSIKSLNSVTIEGALTQAGFSAAEAKTTASTLAMSSANTVATGTTLGLGASIKALGAAIAANPIGLIITGITVAVSALSFGISKYKQAQEEALQTSNELTQAYKEEQKSIDDQILSYKELQKQIKEGNLSTEEIASIKEQLLTVQNNLINSFGDEASGIDLVNGKYKDQINLLSELSKKAAQDYLSTNKAGFEEAKKKLTTQTNYDLGFIGTSSDLSDYLQEYNNPNVLLNNYQDSFYLGVKGTAEEAKNTLKQLYIDIENFGESSGQNVTGLLTDISKGISSVWDNSFDSYQTTYDEYVNAQIIENDTLRSLYNESKDAIKSYNEALASGEGINEATYNLNKLKTQIFYNTDLVDGSKEVFDELFNGIATRVAKASNSLGDAETSILSLTDAMSAMSSSGKTLEDLKDEFKELKYISTDTLDNLIDKYPELEQAIANYISGKITEKDLIAEMSKVYQTDYENYREAIIKKQELDEDFYKDVVANLPTWVKDLAESYGIDFDNFKNLQLSKLEIAKEYEKKLAEIQGLDRLYNSQIAFDPLGINKDAFGGMYSDAKSKLEQEAKDYQKILDGIDLSLNTTLDIDGYKSSSSPKDKKPKKDKTDPIKDAFDAEYNTLKYNLDKQLITEAEYYNAVEKLNKKYYANKKKYLDDFRKYDVEVLKGRQKLEEESIKSKFDDLSHSFAVGDIKTEENYQKQRWELAKDYYKDNKDYLDEWEKAQEEWYKWNLEQTEKSTALEQKKRLDTIDKIIDKYGELRDTINKTAENQTGDTQVSTYSEGIKYANKEIKYIENEIKKLNKRKITNLFTQDDYDSQLVNLQSALSKARSSIDNFNKSISESIKKSSEETMDIIEKSFNKTTEYWENQKKDYSDIIKAQKDILQLKKEQNEYEKSIAKKTKEISKIESRMADLSKAAMTGDRQANAELKKLEEDLADKKEDLSDTQSDHEYDLANDALDKALDDNDKIIDAKLKAIKTEYETQRDNQQKLYDQLIDLTSKASSYSIEAYSKAIDEIASKMTQNGITLDKGYINDLKGAQVQSYNNANPVYSILGTKSIANMSQDTSSLSGLNKFLASQGYTIANKDKMVELAQALGLYNITSPDMVGTDQLGRANKNLIMEELKRLFSGSTFSKGGIGEVVGSLGEHGIGLFRNKEALLSEFDSKNFKDFVPIMNDITKFIKLNIPDTSKLITNKTNSPNINITIPIAGNATPSTVSALNNAGNNIVKQIMDEVRKL